MTNNDTEAMDVLAKIITDQLISDGVAQIDAMKAAGRIIDQLQEARGGTELYVPSLRQQRENEILRDWRQGKKPQEIADERNVDPSTVYRVIKRQRCRLAEDGEIGFGSDDWVL